jgi:hypothetical protein
MADRWIDFCTDKNCPCGESMLIRALEDSERLALDIAMAVQAVTDRRQTHISGDMDFSFEWKAISEKARNIINTLGGER